MIFSIGTTDLSWGNLMLAGNREPLESRLTNLSYTDFLWELNQMKGAPDAASYTAGKNGGGFGNYYVGLITSVPYVRDGKKAATKGSHNQGTDNESIAMKGPWYVSYCGLDTIYKTTGNGKYDFHPDGDGNTYYADRIVLRQEMDYALDKNYVNKYQLGTYYTGVGLWWDSWNTINGGARNYRDLKEVPDGTYFTSTSYSEIFNDYTYNKATGNYAHAEGYHTYVVSSSNAHGEGKTTLITSSENAHAEGLSTVIDNAHEAHVEGNSTKAFNGAHASHAEGTGSYTKGVNAHAENSAYANGNNSHAGGEATAGGHWSFAHGQKGTLASGTYSVAFNNSFTYGDYSFSEGSNNIVNGSYSHAEGEKNRVNSAYSHSEGKSNYVSSSSEISHAEGCYNYIAGLHSHIEGHHNETYGDDTHAEGRENKIGSSAFYSHVEGSYNTIKSSISHSEGTYNIVNGIAGHAEGFTNNVNSNYAHTEGANNVTNGVASHTEGLHNYTYNANEHAQGKWNQAYNTATHAGTLHTIGDGTDATHRHNVVSVFYDGEVDVDSKANVYVNAAKDISTYSETLHLTSPSATFTLDSLDANSDKMHYHVKNEACIKGNYTYFKGSSVTYIGKDAEQNVSANTYITGSTKTEYIGGTSDETTKGKKTIINNGGLSIANNNGHDITIKNTGPVTINTTGSVTKDTVGTVKDTIHGLLTEHVTMSRTTDIDELDTQNHNKGLTDITSGASYYYTTGTKTDAVKGNYNVRVDGKASKSVGGDDNLDVEGNKTTNVTHDYTITSRSTYIISPHVKIGDPAQTVNGENSIVIGNKNTASNQGCAAIGQSNNVNGQASVLLGLGLVSTETAKVAVGKYNKSYTEGIFEVGIGKDNDNRQNAFTTYTSGVTYFHYQPYTYDAYINSVTIGSKQYSSTIYPDQSPVVSLSYYNLSYKGLYDTTTYAIEKINSVDAVQTLDSISRSYTTNTLNYTSGHYDKDQEKNITAKHTIVQNSATKELAGLMSGEDKVRSDDIEDRLNAKVKSAALPTFSLNSITWKVYNNNKSKVLATYTDKTAITAEYGTYVEATNYTIKMNLDANYDAAFLASVTTTGDFKMPPLSDFSPIGGGSAVMTGNLSLSSTYISPYNGNVTSKKVAKADQQVSAILQFGLQYLTTRTLANGHTQVYRINDPDKYMYNQNSFNVKVSGAFGTIRWYGTTNTNPATFASSMTQETLESYLTGQKKSDSTNSRNLVYAGKTDASHKYFFYVYRKALGAVTSVMSTGANATGWFNTTSQKTIRITRTVTGMQEDYYLMYTMNENGLSKGDNLTFS